MKFLKLLDYIDQWLELWEKRDHTQEPHLEELENSMLISIQLIVIFVATMITAMFYPFIPAPIRLFAVPFILIGSIFVSRKMSSNAIHSMKDSLCSLEVIEINKEEEKHNSRIGFPFKKVFLKHLVNPPNLAVISALVSSALFFFGFLFNQVR